MRHSHYNWSSRRGTAFRLCVVKVFLLKFGPCHESYTLRTLHLRRNAVDGSLSLPLDFNAISSQVNQMSSDFVSLDRESRIMGARELLQCLDPEVLRARLDAPKFNTSWLVARPVGTLSGMHACLKRPSSFSVAAADGSFIAPDRHSPVRYYVINTGSVLLTYGQRPDAHLSSSAEFFHSESDLYVPHDYKVVPVEGALLGVKLALQELRALLQTVRAALGTHPVVALRDGSLIFWALQAEEDEISAPFLEELVSLLNQFRDAGLPLASYISYPNSRDVVNLLRVGVCPDDPVSCDHCTARAAKREPKCVSPGRVIDRWVFERELPAGFRSDIFESSSPILNAYGMANRIGFFYLNVGDEIARVEAPHWVLEDERHVNLVHALVYDQCAREGGYPVALMEAHEQAVITAAERRVVEEMVEETLNRHGAFERRSAKDGSKRLRGL